MKAFQKQLHIWACELGALWERVPFIGRVIIGSLGSLAIVFVANDQWIKPLNEAINALNDGLEIPANLNPLEDDEILMHRERARNLRESLDAWKVRLEALNADNANLTKAAHIAALAQIQSVMERCQLTVVSERLLDLVETTNSLPTGSRQRQSKTLAAPVSDGPVKSFIHALEARGGFRNFQAFLLLVESIPYRLQISNFRIRTIAGRPGLLQASFTLEIFYLKDSD